MIGKFRAWMRREMDRVCREERGINYEMGYRQAMQDVAQYFDFPLKDEHWERWKP